MALVGINTFRPTIGGDGRGDSEQVVGAGATTNIFTVLGQRIHIGRGFVDEDGTPQPPPPQVAPPPQGAPAPPAAAGPPPPPPLPNIAVLSYEFWQRRYGGDESIVGKSIEFGNGRAEIVGVLAPGFELLFPPGTNVEPRPDIVVANRVNFETGSRNNVFLRVVAKLKPGVSFKQAQAELDQLSADLRKRFPIKQTSNMNLRIEPMHEDLVADVRPQLVALMGAVVFVLLIACANVANLLLVRASARERELAVRAAIGGSRWRLVRQLVAESLVLAAIGGAVGLLARAIRHRCPDPARAGGTAARHRGLARRHGARVCRAVGTRRRPDLRRRAGGARLAPGRDGHPAFEPRLAGRRVRPVAARRRRRGRSRARVRAAGRLGPDDSHLHRAAERQSRVSIPTAC